MIGEKCVVLVPVGSHIETDCERGLVELERRGYVVRRVSGYAAIDQGRSQMATDALADGFDSLMWIDSDIGFDADDVDRLRAHEQPIVCGIYPKKGRRALACHVKRGTPEITFGEGGALLEIEYAATGFLYTRREAYEAIRRDARLPLCNRRFGRPIVPYFLPMCIPDGASPDDHWYLGEDFAFCERAKRSGLRVLADTSIRLKHIGRYGYSWEDAGRDVARYRRFTFRVNA